MTPAQLRRWRPPALSLPSWPWHLTWTYLGLILFLPLGAMLLKAARVCPVGFWEMATTPEALATYRVSFGLALVASVINGMFGLVVAWALVRSRFPGLRLLDALIDLPFALPFSISPVVVGLLLLLLYSPTQGLLGGVVESLGWRIIFSWPGIVLATIIVTFPFMARGVIALLEEEGWE